jgi:hypothetical protein
MTERSGEREAHVNDEKPEEKRPAESSRRRVRIGLSCVYYGRLHPDRTLIVG